MAPGTTPHQGKSSTKARNKRKNEQRKLKKLIELGVLPEGTNHAGYLEYLAGKQVNGPLERQIEPTKQLTPKQLTQKHPISVKQPELAKSLGKSERPKDSEAVNPANKRKRYRKAFAKAKKNGTVPDGQNLDTWIQEREQKRNVEKKKDDEGDIVPDDVDENIEWSLTTANEVPTEESSKQRDIPGRPSVDLDVLRRTVLHNLAISKKGVVATAGEELMRKEWAQTHRKDTVNKRKGSAGEQYSKRAKIIYDDNGNPVSMDTEDTPVAFVEPEDPNAWREKLVLTAVECELEGVELPPPTFPFKQPFFQNLNEIAGNKRKRKGGRGKKQRQQQEDYWGNGNCDYNQEDGYYQQQQDNWACDYYDDTTQPQNANNNQVADTIMEEIESVDDLPPLPEDISSLPPLTKPVLLQTVIAFKQLTMDANYTPILADYRTAIIEEVDDQVQGGPFLVVKLAIRDRLKRNVDKETGEKVLRKFEMPGNSDDDEGRIELMFEELLEPKVVKLPEAAELSDAQDKLKDGDNDGQNNIDKATDSAGVEKAMDDAPREEHQDNASGLEHHDAPASRKGENTVKPATAVDGETIVEEEAVGEKAASSHTQPPPRDESVIEKPQEQDTNLQVGTPVVSQAAHTHSPVYSQDYSEFKTPEPEAQRDVPMTDEDDYQPPINDEGDSTFQPEYESDSDGLPTLESILASQSQRVSIKRESTQLDDEPQLPPLPQFSPLGMKVQDDTAESPEEERSLDEQQIQQEVEGAKNNKPGRGRPKKLIGSSQVQIIDLTVTSSDPPVEENRKRGRPRGRKAKGGHWRAVKN